MRMVLHHEVDHPCRWAAVTSIAEKIGCLAQTLPEWVKKAEVDSGERAGVPTGLKELECENRELRQANEILRKAPAYFAQVKLDPVEVTITFIDDNCRVHRVEPICNVLPIARSTYHSTPCTGRMHGAVGLAVDS